MPDTLKEPGAVDAPTCMSESAQMCAPDTTSVIKEKPRDRVITFCGRDIASIAGYSTGYAVREVVPALVTDGVLYRRGRRWAGRIVDIESWLAGSWTPPARRGRAQRSAR